MGVWLGGSLLWPWDVDACSLGKRAFEGRLNELGICSRGRGRY